MGKLTYILIILLPLIFSCEAEAPLSQAELSERDDPRITMDMDEDLLLTIGVKNFKEKVSFMGFKVMYDTNKLSKPNVTPGDFTVNFSSYDHNNIEEDELSIGFSGVNGSGDLLKLQFGGSSYNGVKILLADIAIYDSNENDWIADKPLTVEGMCYIDDGLVLQGTVNTDQPIEDWESTGNYIWSNYFCQYYE